MQEKWLTHEQIEDIFSPNSKDNRGYWAIFLSVFYFFLKIGGYYVCLYLLAKTVVLVNSGATLDYLREIVPPISQIVTDVFSGLVFIVVAYLFFGKRELHKTNLKSPAWNLGQADFLIKGGIAGIVLGVSFVSIVLFLFHLRPLISVTNVSSQENIVKIVFLLRLLIAPFFEELIFRGVLFGYLNASFGFYIAVIVSTIFFVVPHYFDRSFEFYNLFMMSLVALSAIYFRIKSSAVGPAVAFHLTYNVSVATAIVILWRIR